jgi:hypothetical protein
MRPILFLDMDGVCNDHVAHPRTRYCRTDPACVERLDRILIATDAEIVLTSSWRYLVHSGQMTLVGLRNLLHTHWIDGERLIGITRRDISDLRPRSRAHTDRGPQITEWIVDRFGVDPFVWEGSYVVLDDLDLEIGNCGHPFVQTIGTVGLTDADADRAIAILLEGR